VQPPNTARFIFLSSQAAEFFGDWETICERRGCDPAHRSRPRPVRPTIDRAHR
jgi:hypothetical protein